MTRTVGIPRNRSVYATARARIGKNTAPDRLLITAMKSANTRMNTSASRKACTLSRNRRAISGNDSRNTSTFKKDLRTSGQPGEFTTTRARAVKTTAVLTRATATPRRPSTPPPRILERRSPASGAGWGGAPGGVPRTLFARGGELTHDDSVIDLHRDDDEGGGDVGHHAVDLSVLEGLDGVVEGIEHGRILVRLDLLLDHGEAGGPHRRPELERHEVRDRGRVGDRRSRHGHQPLTDVVVRVTEVDGLVALRGVRDLVDEEVEVLGPGPEGLVERDLHPLDLLAGEPEPFGHRVGHRALVPLARRWIVELPW